MNTIFLYKNINNVCVYDIIFIIIFFTLLVIIFFLREVNIGFNVVCVFFEFFFMCMNIVNIYSWKIYSVLWLSFILICF